MTSTPGRPRRLPPGTPRRRPYLEGKKAVSVYLTLQHWHALQKVATKINLSHNALMNKALEDFTAKHGEQPKPPQNGKKPTRHAKALRELTHE